MNEYVKFFEINQINQIYWIFQEKNKSIPTANSITNIETFAFVPVPMPVPSRQPSAGSNKIQVAFVGGPFVGGPFVGGPSDPLSSHPTPLHLHKLESHLPLQQVSLQK